MRVRVPPRPPGPRRLRAGRQSFKLRVRVRVSPGLPESFTEALGSRRPPSLEARRRPRRGGASPPASAREETRIVRWPHPVANRDARSPGAAGAAPASSSNIRADTAGGKAQSPREPHKLASSVQLGGPLPSFIRARGEAANAAVCKTAIRWCKSTRALAGVVQQQNLRPVSGRWRCNSACRLHSSQWDSVSGSTPDC